MTPLGGHGTLDEKIPILVMNVNENCGKSVKENSGKNTCGLR